MKIERVAVRRNQRTELANAKPSYNAEGAMIVDGIVTLTCQANAATRVGAPFAIEVTLSETEIERAMAALQIAKGELAERLEPTDLPKGLRDL